MGIFYSSTGTPGGAVVSLMVARVPGRELFERLLGSHIDFCTVCVDKRHTKIVFLSRLLPIVSLDIIRYGAGLSAEWSEEFQSGTPI